jgi:hypothetical protein
LPGRSRTSSKDYETMAVKKVEKTCASCGAIRLCENRKGRQIMCRACRSKPENMPNYRGVGRMVACIDCGKLRKTFPCYETNGRKPVARCRPCNVASYHGSGNPHWLGGITPANKRIRGSREYTEWRIAVFQRDAYTCQECGQVGGELHADHIKPFSMFAELRFDVSNGRALCRRCHMLTPSYLGGARKLEKQARMLIRNGPLLPFPVNT